MPRTEAESREAFALFDKRGTGSIPLSSLGELLRALGQNPTNAEVASLSQGLKSEVDYATFEKVLNRPEGDKPVGTVDDFVRGFQVFDKDRSGLIGVGELKYVLTTLGEKLSEAEVEELLKGVKVNSDGTIDYVQFAQSILAQ